MSHNHKPSIIIAVSACLLGQPVRYDGQHKRDHELIKTLEAHFQLQAFCPEVAIGMGVPRPPIQLQELGGRKHAVGVDDSSQDVTCELQDVGKVFASQYPGVCGYVFKSRSPSCALHSAAIFHNSTSIATNASGIFAETVMRELPLLPVVEDSQLQNLQAIHDFSNKVIHYYKSLQT